LGDTPTVAAPPTSEDLPTTPMPPKADGFELPDLEDIPF